MAGERRLNWGADATDAKWRTEHDTTDGKFIVAEDLDGGTVLLEYDETAGEFVSRGPVNLDGNDVTNVGALDATSVSAGGLTNSGSTDYTNLSDASVRQLYKASLNSDDVIGQVTQYTSDVAQTATEILGQSSFTPIYYDVLVIGENDAGDKRFADRVRGLALDNSVSADKFDDGEADGRTYAISSNGGLALTMGGGTYQVGVFGTSMRVT